MYCDDTNPLQNIFAKFKKNVECVYNNIICKYFKN